VPLRERAFDLFYEFAKENNLGEVHSMGIYISIDPYHDSYID
jgi:hypothetical protein